MRSNLLVLTSSFLIALLLVALVSHIVYPVNYASGEEEEYPYGGTFRVGWSETLDTLKMGQEIAWSLLGCAILSTVYEELAFMGPPPNYDEFVPMLATSWEVSEDYTTWIFHLDPKAKWHDGKPVTAGDVAFTVKYLIKVPVWNGTDTDAKEVEIIDDHTVKIVMKQPITLSVPLWWVPILPKHIWWDYRDDILSYDNKEAIGSGPFILEEWEPGKYFKLKANEDYHLGRPYIDYLIFKSYSSEDALIMALLKGEIDMIAPYALSPSAAHQIMKEGNPNVNIKIDTGDSFYWLTINLKRPGLLGDLLRNLEFRKALAYSIDKSKIAEVAFLGYADPVDVPIYKEMDYYNPNIKGYEYNVTKANKILDELGWKDIDGDGIREGPDEITDLILNLLIIGTNPYHVKIATSITEDLAKVGIKVNVVPVDDSAYWNILGGGPENIEYHLILFYEAIGPDITFALEPLLTGSWSNVGGYSNEEYDELFYNFTSQPDRSKRVKIARRMQEIMLEDLPVIYLVNPNALTAYRTDKFEGFVFGIGGAWTWFSPWTFRKVHLKPGLVEKPKPTPDYTPWIIAGVAIVVAVIAIVYAVKIRGRR